MVPGLLCQHPCRTCLSSNTASCTSCYTDSDTIIEKYLLSSVCLSSCPDGYYADSNYQCQECDYRCNTCSSGSTCDTCSTSSTYKYMYESMCYISCPVSTYEDSTYECEDCRTPCDSCTGQGNGNCLSCLQSNYNSLQYQLGTTCYSSCPEGYLASGSKVCVECTSPCSTCAVTKTQCTSCVSSYYLYGTQCVQECPTSYIAVE